MAPAVAQAVAQACDAFYDFVCLPRMLRCTRNLPLYCGPALAVRKGPKGQLLHLNRGDAITVRGGGARTAYVGRKVPLNCGRSVAVDAWVRWQPDDVTEDVPTTQERWARLRSVEVQSSLFFCRRPVHPSLRARWLVKPASRWLTTGY